MSWIDAMLALQSADDRRRRLETKLSVLPGELQDLKKRAAANRAKQKETENDLLRAEQGIRQAENDIAGLRSEIEKLRQQSVLVRKNTEYNSMLAQVAALEKKIGDRETFILESMDAVEAKKRILRAATSETEAANASLKAEFGELQTLATDLRNEIAKQQSEVAKLEHGLAPELLARYRTLFEKGESLPLVAVEAGICAGCHLRVTQQTMAKITREEVAYCDNCMHFIYLPES